MSIYEGIIPRQRLTEKLNEKSAIAVFIVSGKLLPYTRKMVLDEKCEKLFHIIETPQIKPHREELFDFKSVAGQKIFCEITNNSEKLRKSFRTDEDFIKQTANFENTLKGVFHRSFKKIRGTKRKQDKSEVQGLMQERKKIKTEIKTSPNCEAQNRLGQVEQNLASLLSNKNRNRVNEILQNIANSDNSCNTLGMRKQVKKLFPKVLKNVSMGDFEL